MRRHVLLLALATTAIAAPLALHAQRPDGPRPEGPPPGGPMGRGPMGRPPRGAEFLLAHTGELQLTDAQVVKLAAIARRADARHRAMRATMDSLRAQPRPGDGPPRGFEQAREAERADLRDALAVLTPDQQATAWAMAEAPRGPEGPRGPGRGEGRPQ